MKVRQNCWQYKQCGRGPGGEKEKELGICAAATELRLNGIHGGMNGGRACWVVAGTFCQGKASGSFAQKYNDCKDCDFYKKVLTEDCNNFKLTLDLMSRLK